MGPEATVELYKNIVRIFQQRFGAKYDDDFPEILVINQPIPDIVESTEKVEEIKQMLVGAGKKLQAAGVDFIAIPCNTVHVFLEEIKSSISIPIIDIVEITNTVVNNRNFKKIGLLATNYTIEKELFKDIKPMYPEDIVENVEAIRNQLTRLIIRVMEGSTEYQFDSLIAEFWNFVKMFEEKNCDAVILGCTELSVLYSEYLRDEKRKNKDKISGAFSNPADGKIQIIDTLQLLADEVVARATSS